MPLIPYPAVPAQPGVPPIPRQSSASQNATIELGPITATLPSSSSEPMWGIYDSDGNPIYSPTEGGTLSVLSFGMSREMQVSDFPVEANDTSQGAAFASFNKVFTPINPVVTYAMAGSDTEKTNFLKSVDAACSSTNIYNVYTPDDDYIAPQRGCTVERYSYQRSATRGATLLIVEISLKQVLQVTAALSNVKTGSSISSPQSPSASGTVSNGNTQTVTSQLMSGTFLKNYPPIGVK